MSRIFGPTYGTMMDAVDVMAGGANAVIAGDEDGNAKERNAVRKIIRRIPLAGSDTVTAEGWTNWIAGEQEAR
jgi:N-acetylmuramic acid 6-phosphate (MurNAc-6-P) etherase